MSYMNCRVKRAALGVAILWGILGLILLLPATAWAGGHTVKVPPPNGVDDTAKIQGALNKCKAYGAGCTVQLQAGTYHTKQVIIHNFQGTFKGVGKASTTIEALFLPANFPDPSLVEACNPNFTDCLWTTLITFIDGNINVSDLTINVTLVPAAQTWVDDGVDYENVFAPLEFTGRHPMNVTIDRIAINGQPDPNDPFGFNIENGVHYSGEFARSKTPGDYYFLSGSYTVRNSYFNNTGVAISEDGFVTSSLITIAGNYTQNDQSGIDLESSQKSIFEISNNNTSGMGAGMWVVPYSFSYVASGPSLYLIHDNTFTGTGQYISPANFPDGIFLYDDITNPWIQAAIWKNHVPLQCNLCEGIGVYNTKGTAVWNNTVTGSDELDGIGLWSSSLDTVVGNNVSGVTVDSSLGFAQIYLDPYTNQDLVVCAERSDTVLNQGTNNAIIGCQQSAASAEAATRTAPTTSTTRPNILKKKPRVP
jgi:hypothetical protein